MLNLGYKTAIQWIVFPQCPSCKIRQHRNLLKCQSLLFPLKENKTKQNKTHEVTHWSFPLLKNVLSTGKVGKGIDQGLATQDLWATFGCSLCFCTACELRIVFTFLRGFMQKRPISNLGQLSLERGQLSGPNIYPVFLAKAVLPQDFSKEESRRKSASNVFQINFSTNVKTDFSSVSWEKRLKHYEVL